MTDICDVSVVCNRDKVNIWKIFDIMGGLNYRGQIQVTIILIFQLFFIAY